MISNFDCTDNQASSKVLRPPGGGSSDIFGSEMPQTPRNVKNRMVSNIFAAEKDNGVKNNVRQGAHRFYFIGDAPRRGQKTVDSHSRLFGEPSRPITPGKNHMKSSIPFGGQNSEAAAAQKLLTTNGHYNGKSGSVSSASSSVSSSTENLKMNNGSRSEGNPVTGEGYKAGGNDFHQRQESSNGGTPVINKNRVPPGGYSSGLW
ncbi:microtubule-associated protein Jupiter isoform X6 [Drosophila gunungcola]|uniref:microtubule-associated protein Jupiter isoform X7 n=1 Tax=Drosophila elegans TaxID=30023 RepID=UPI0007E7B481|nr:microtubule-associated protein Jupiter isoform X7 [Drosophila elegans]XP_052838031.1 microtubule-associated protein Jupiter isoform X6 [Drosophila gunungcola]